MISTVSHSKSCLYFHDLAVFLCWLHENFSCRMADTDLHHIRLIAFEAHQDFMAFRSLFKFQNKRKTHLIFTVHPPWTFMEHFSIQLRGQVFRLPSTGEESVPRPKNTKRRPVWKLFLEMFKLFFWNKKKYSPRKLAYLISPEKCWFGPSKKVTCWCFFGGYNSPCRVGATCCCWCYINFLSYINFLT